MGFNRVARRYYNTVKHAGLNRLSVLLLLLLPSPSNSLGIVKHNFKVVLKYERKDIKTLEVVVEVIALI